jgi:hypothetical protein
MQTLLDFTVHSRENNSHSQSILESQYERLSNNCKKLYEAMSKGRRLTGMDCINMGMIEYRRRFKDMIDAGIPVKSEMVGNVKQWYL